MSVHPPTFSFNRLCMVDGKGSLKGDTCLLLVSCQVESDHLLSPGRSWSRVNRGGVPKRGQFQMTVVIRLQRHLGNLIHDSPACLYCLVKSIAIIISELASQCGPFSSQHHEMYLQSFWKESSILY